MSLLLASDFSKDDRDGWLIFLFEHSQEHKRIALAVQQKYLLTPVHYPISDLGDPQIWQFGHNDMHQSLAQILDLGNIPDLASADFNDEEQFQTWMQNHAALHEQIDLLLGL